MPKFANIYVLLIFVISSCTESRYPGPLSPEESMKTFQLHDDFEVEIFATEPYVKDPVSMVFDEAGNIYVVEMPDYPFKPEPDEGEGKIKLLRDTDGDGRIDEATVFVENIAEATSMLPWKDGLLVTAAPHIYYFKDEDGDGVAESSEILFSGFFEHNSEAQITNLRYGVDNWIYASNHGQAGEVTSTFKPDEPPIQMRGADFRFRMDKELYELTTGPGQFGLTLDDFGNRFFTQNTLHIRHAVIPRRYVFRHNHLPSTVSITNISDHELEMFQETPPPYWRAERTRRRNEAYQEQNLDRVEYAEDHFTGASGGTIYLGDAFPDEFYGDIFTGEVAGNLVHRDVITPHPEHPTFIASRADEEKDKEFLSSTDSWFRPSNFAVGPDGYLYVIDMYRQHIETPLSIPEDLKEEMDFLYGSEHGRIYRIKPKTEQPREMLAVDLRSKPANEYIGLLGHTNQWWRLQAQRLLVERQDKSVIPDVTDILNTHEDPRARVHALYVLEGLDALTPGIVRQAMTDSHAGVRKHGVILSERFPECLPQLLESVDEPSIETAFQVTLSLGEFSGPQVIDAFAKLTDKYGHNQWFRTGILSSEPGSSPALIEELWSQKSFFESDRPEHLVFFEHFSHVIGSRNQKDQVNAYFNFLTSTLKDKEDWQNAGIKGFSAGLGRSADDDLKEKLSGLEDLAKEGVNAWAEGIKELLENR